MSGFVKQLINKHEVFIASAAGKESKEVTGSTRKLSADEQFALELKYYRDIEKRANEISEYIRLWIKESKEIKEDKASCAKFGRRLFNYFSEIDIWNCLCPSPFDEKFKNYIWDLLNIIQLRSFPELGDDDPAKWVPIVKSKLFPGRTS